MAVRKALGFSGFLCKVLLVGRKVLFSPQNTGLTGQVWSGCGSDQDIFFGPGRILGRLHVFCCKPVACFRRKAGSVLMFSSSFLSTLWTCLEAAGLCLKKKGSSFQLTIFKNRLRCSRSISIHQILRSLVGLGLLGVGASVLVLS